MKSLVVLICIAMLFGGARLMGGGSGGGFNLEEDPWEDGSDGFDSQPSDSLGPYTIEPPGDYDLLHLIPGLPNLDLIHISQDQLQSTLNPLLRNP
jgi:hypothetical protein